MTTSEKVQIIIKPYRHDRVCEAAGITPPTLRNLVRGEGNPSLESIKRVAAALGVDWVWLIDESRGMPVVWAGKPGVQTATLAAVA